MNQTPDQQISTRPPIIRREKEGQEFQIFRVRKGGIEAYELLCGGSVLFTFSPWQYHVLCSLFSYGGDNYETLLVNVNDRFGSRLTRIDLKTFFGEVAARDLFDEKEAEKHSLIRAVILREEEAEEEREIKADGPSEAETAEVWNTRYLFNPTAFLKRVSPVLQAARLLIYPLPFLVFAAFILLWQNVPAVVQEVEVVKSGINIVTGAIFSLFTINLLSVFTTAAVAYSYGGTVRSISLVWFYGFIPRFSVACEDIEKFTHGQKLWFHAAPLLMRLGVFSISTLMWYHGRELQGTLSQFFATLALISGLSVLLASCPFYKSSGYDLVAEFLGDPGIRKKAFNALLNKYRRNSYTQVDSNILAVYALACLSFVFALSISIILLLHQFLSFEMGSRSLVVVLAFVLFAAVKLRKRFHDIALGYNQKQQFERWRQRLVPQEVTSPKNDNENKTDKRIFGFLSKKFVAITVLLILLCPYTYRASGRVTLMPLGQQQISTDIPGIIDEVLFDGGEALEEGTVIARLSVKDQQAQLEIAQGKLAEQKAYIEQLKAMPSEEDVAVAQQKLETARVQWTYGDAQCSRQKILYDSGAISLDAYDTARKACDGDQEKMREAEAELFKVMAGPTPEQVATAETALQTISAQIALYQDQIERSTFRMPFKGRLAAINLKEKKGDFLERGIALAMAEDDSAFKIALEIPETDVPYTHVGAAVDIRLAAQPGKVFKGILTAIDSNVGSQPYGKTVEMIATLENNAEELKSGMTGYAKVEGESLMVWQVLTRAIYRFITVEMWAWIP